MNRDEWPVVRRTLRAGWPAGEIDDDAYIGMLGAFSQDDVKAGISSMLGSALYLPKVSEIVGAIRRAKQALPSTPVARGLRGDAAVRRVGSRPWMVNGRFFFPVVDSVLLVDRKDDAVVSCSGWWDQDEGDHMVWESWSTALIGSAAKQVAA